MLSRARRCLPAACLLLAAAASAAGQGGVSPEKRAAIGRLLELTTPAKTMNTIFSRLVREHKGPAGDSMVADLKAKGLFKPFTPEKAARMERLVRETSDRIFDGIEAEVVGQVNTPENVEAAAAPALDKYLTAGELGELVAFLESPVGRKFVRVYPEMAAEVASARVKAKGLFGGPGLPDASAGNLERFAEEFAAGSPGQLERMFAEAAARQFTADELRTAAAFGETPVGKKIQAEFPRIQGEIYRAFISAHAQQVLGIARRVTEAEIRAFSKRALEAER